MTVSDEASVLWDLLTDAGLIPRCAGCQREARLRDYCQACRTFICDPCDPHVPEHHDDPT